MKHFLGTPIRLINPFFIAGGVAFILLAGALAGCSQKSPAALSNSGDPSSSTGEIDPGTESTKTSSLNQKLASGLLSINSVYIAQPVLSRQVIGIDPNIVRSKVEEAFLAESSMTLIKQKPTGTSPCEAARTSRADGCLVVTLDRYQELEGSSLAAENKAAVTFTVELVRSDDKTVVFAKNFDFIDQAFSENILNAADTVNQKGGSSGYATASSVFSRGVRSAFRELDTLRTKQFLKR